MAKAILPTNFTDDVLNESMDGKRRYNMIPNADGSQSLEDVTAYDQLGSNFGASNINSMNQAINESFDVNKMLKTTDELEAVTQEGYGVDALLVKSINDSLQEQPTFVYDEDGKITGYKTKVGADTVFPFKSAGDYEMINNTTFPNTSGTVTATSDYKGIFVSMPLNTTLGTNKYSSIKINGEEKVNEALCSTDGTVMFLPIIGYNGDSIAITRTVNYATVNVAFVN